MNDIDMIWYENDMIDLLNHIVIWNEMTMNMNMKIKWLSTWKYRTLFAGHCILTVWLYDPHSDHDTWFHTELDFDRTNPNITSFSTSEWEMTWHVNVRCNMYPVTVSVSPF